MKEEFIQLASKHFENTIKIKQAFLSSPELMSSLIDIAIKCSEVYHTGNKILIAGNGGSAADAQHFAGELVSRFYFDRPALAAIALTTDTSIITAIGNDYGYEDIFSRQIEANAAGGDVFIAISTSGSSANILKAIEAAQERGVWVIGLTGQGGGKMAEMCNQCLCVPSNDTPLIQETHLSIEHIICMIIEIIKFNRAED